MADRQYIGCIHVHSTYSDGAATVPEILGFAAEAGLDYVVLSDHSSDGPRTGGYTGWHNSLLCLSAPEIGRKGDPHFMAFCPANLQRLLQRSPVEALAAAREQGTVTFLAHPHPADFKVYKRPPAGWDHVDGYPFDGLEVWSYLHDVCYGLNPWRLARFWSHHESLVHGPRPETLRMWDDLCRRRRVAGIGALDNHAMKLPIVGPTLPHLDLFRLHRTHVVCPELPADGDAAEHALAAALAAGRSFVAMDGWGDAFGFTFRAEGPNLSLTLGDEAAFSGATRLVVVSPLTADLTVIGDGEIMERRAGATSLELPLRQPGVYRVEARLKGRPWVFTNPVYLRDADHVPAEPERR